MGNILDGKSLAQKLNLELKNSIRKTLNNTGIKPKLATILVGEDPASQIYVNIKRKTCLEVDIESLLIFLNQNAQKDELMYEIENLNNDKNIHGILLQLPLPKHSPQG